MPNFFIPMDYFAPFRYDSLRKPQIFFQIISHLEELCFPLCLNTEIYNNPIKYTQMKGLLKNLGLILVFLGAIVLIYGHFTGNVNNNALLGTGGALGVIGLILYIVFNKKYA